MADANAEGHLRHLLQILEGPDWGGLPELIGLQVETFAGLSLAANVPDSILWGECQQVGIVLVTVNRNADGPASLEATIRADGTLMSLPVLTIAAPLRVLRDRAYAGQVAARLAEILFDLESYRGAGRIYLP